MAWYNKLIGGGVKELADGVGSVTKSIGNLGLDIRSAITGDMKPETKARLEELAQKATNTSNEGQQVLNAIEAQSSNIFIAGWRPAIGWVCVIALFMYYVVRTTVQLSVWVFQVYHSVQLAISKGTLLTLEIIPAPNMDISDIIGLVMALLGMAGMRSYEKNKGVAR